MRERKRYTAVVVGLCVALLLSGCSSWLTGSYFSVTPHEEYHNSQSKDSLEAVGRQELTQVLIGQVENGRESCVVYVSGIDAKAMANTMDAIVADIRQENPIGAFAVEEITYDVGTSTGRMAVAVQITYNRSRTEILKIKKVTGMEAAFSVVTDALESCQPGAVVLVDGYEEQDIIQKIQDHTDAHPDICMELPQVSVSVYPQSGEVRVLELTFSYQNSREVLREMQQYVQPIFRAAVLNVSAEESAQVRYSRMYAFLMERMDYQTETSMTPAYSLLRHGVGDSKAFATVYAAMCRSAGMECYVISGTRSGEPWFWNMICQDGVHYHLDLLQSNAAGDLVLYQDTDMSGYVWDYSAYPEAKKPTAPVVEEQITEPTEPVTGETPEDTSASGETQPPAATDPTQLDTLPEEN